MAKKPIILNEAVIKKHNLTIPQFITLLAIANRVNFEVEAEALYKKRFIHHRDPNLGIDYPYYVPTAGRNILTSLLTDVTSDGITDEYITEVAKAMQEMFPEGKKPGTTYYWRGSTPEICRKLKEFYKKYGNNYSKEEMVIATKKYVDSFNISKTYMQLLKYFIVKHKGSGEEVSELCSYLENGDQTSISTDWSSTLV